MRGGTDENHENLRVVGVVPEIRTGHLSNARQKPFPLPFEHEMTLSIYYKNYTTMYLEHRMF
jgi:hypothetical protein